MGNFQSPASRSWLNMASIEGASAAEPTHKCCSLRDGFQGPDSSPLKDAGLRTSKKVAASSIHASWDCSWVESKFLTVWKLDSNFSPGSETTLSGFCIRLCMFGAEPCQVWHTVILGGQRRDDPESSLCISPLQRLL